MPKSRFKPGDIFVSRHNPGRRIKLNSIEKNLIFNMEFVDLKNGQIERQSEDYNKKNYKLEIKDFTKIP